MTYHDNNSTQQWAYDNAGNLQSRTTVNGETQLFFTTSAISSTQTGGATGTTSFATLTGATSIMTRLAGLPKLKMGRTVGSRTSFPMFTGIMTPPGTSPRSSKLSPGCTRCTLNYPTYDDDGKLTRMYES